jgi:hypothetical protein
VVKAVPAPIKRIQSKSLLIRGSKAMLDKDLAALYGSAIEFSNTLGAVQTVW